MNIQSHNPVLGVGRFRGHFCLYQFYQVQSRKYRCIKSHFIHIYIETAIDIIIFYFSIFLIDDVQDKDLSFDLFRH